jgi:enhancing lycopene biosynthesis protein 2
MKRVGVILSGCGVYDGSEIHEAVITLLALDRAGVEAVCMAPDIDQTQVVNHLTGSVSPDEKRNVLVESARIARGKIHDIGKIKASSLDAVILPGGFGAVKNLSDFAIKGENCIVHPKVAKLLREMNVAQKPIGALCISPAVVSAVFRDDPQVKPSLTIGTDAETGKKLQLMGSNHVPSPVRECVVDEKNKIVSTPAYMLAQRISEAATGIERLVEKVLALA